LPASSDFWVENRRFFLKLRCNSIFHCRIFNLNVTSPNKPHLRNRNKIWRVV
jgi:hypothetical protein